MKTTLFLARRSRNRSSAELYSAVSRICNPLAVAGPNAPAKPDALPNAIRRYSRLKICATSKHAVANKVSQESRAFMDGNAQSLHAQTARIRSEEHTSELQSL